MRTLLFLLLGLRLCAQQVFIELDSVTRFPKNTFDSLHKYTVVLLGEMHGTREAPTIVHSFVNLLLSQNKNVIVALEMPAENQASINLFLKTGDINLLKQLDFFNTIKDGRSSKAMAELIERLCKKENVSVFCFDINKNVGGKGYRDSAMAQNLLTIKKQNPNTFIISLSGNIHSNIKPDFRKGYETMGYYLKKELGSELLSLNIRYKNGTAYNCMSDGCKERNLEEDNSQFKNYLKKEGYLLIDKGFENSGYNGIIYLKKVTASLPFINP